MYKTKTDVFFSGLLGLLFTFAEESPLTAPWRMQFLDVFVFFLAAAGFFLSVDITKEPKWRSLYIKNSTKYKTGVTEVGLWKICFPPTIKGSDNYSINCCYRFALFEKFLPVEMKIGQILMPIASFLAFLGLFFSCLAFRCRRLSPRQTVWIFIAGGTSYMISSICILVPFEWNRHSLEQNKTILFPSSFHLPPLTEQSSKVPSQEGIASAIFLLVSGTFIVVRNFARPVRILPILPI